MTDVTGFGFLGISGRWLRKSIWCSTKYQCNSVFDGVIELIASGTTSSLQESNESVLQEFVIDLS